MIEIRRAAAADLPLFVRIEEASFGPEDRFSRRQLRALLARENTACWIADETAFACWVDHHNRHREWTRLYTLAVHPDARGRGLAQALLADGLSRLGTDHARRCFAEVAADNHVARRLYTRAGFRERRVLPDYYGPGRHGLSLMWESPPHADGPRAAS